MTPFRDLISFDEAVRRIAERTRPVERTERVPLAEAGGRVLANDFESPIDVPGFVRSAMDGYAVRAVDTFGASRTKPKKLRLAGKVFAGSVPRTRAAGGVCVQAATGAPLPEGADAVVKVEETSISGNTVSILKPVYPGENVSGADSDLAKGAAAIRAGDILTPPRIGVLAAVGMTRIEVYARPRVTVHPTGDEVQSPGHRLAPAKVYDINSFTVSSLLARAGAQVVSGSKVGDSVAAIRTAIKKAAKSDYLVFSGGSSVGERDLLASVVEDMGELVFHGIALKPGKPTMFGVVGETLVFGMPGYPTSCLTNAYALLAPSVARAARIGWEPRVVETELAEPVVKTVGRHQLYTVRLEGNKAYPAFKESGAITSMSQADGYIDIPANTEFLAKGERVRVVLF